MAIEANFIVETPEWLSLPEEVKLGDIKLFGPGNIKDPRFLPSEPERPLEYVPDSTTMIDLLAMSGIFRSKSEARKNWKGPIEIPYGFSDHYIGKLKNRITIYKYKPTQQGE